MTMFQRSALSSLVLTMIFVKVSYISATDVEKARDGWADQGVNEKGQHVQQLKVEAPMMTEEDQYGYNMPDMYRCDACKAVIFHLNKALVRKQPKSRRLKEWEYTELFEETCGNDFDGYGIKWVGGQNVLSGPGIKQEDNLQPGGAAIQMGGENWSKRMGEICRKLVFEKIGEEDLYDKFHGAGELGEDICFQDTRECRHGPSTPPPAKKGAEKEKMEKKDAKGKKEKSKKDRNILKDKMSKPTVDEKKAAGASSNDRPVDVITYLTKLAVEHGSAPNAYTKNRSAKEWERLVVQLASRIYERQSNAEEAIVNL